MRLCFFDGLDRIEICDRNEFGAGQLDRGVGRRGYVALEGRIDMHEAWQAERFVRRYFQGGEDMHRLRSLLSSQSSLIHRLADEDVLRQVSSSLQSGHLRAYMYKHSPVSPIRVPTPAATGPVSAPAVRPPVTSAEKTRSPASQPSTQPSPNEDELEQQARAEAAQDTEAAMLEEGAKGAIPFCEICERMKAKLKSGT